jgi:hypothetical protein
LLIGVLIVQNLSLLLGQAWEMLLDLDIALAAPFIALLSLLSSSESAPVAVVSCFKAQVQIQKPLLQISHQCTYLQAKSPRLTASTSVRFSLFC